MKSKQFRDHNHLHYLILNNLMKFFSPKKNYLFSQNLKMHLKFHFNSYQNSLLNHFAPNTKQDLVLITINFCPKFFD